MTEKFTERPLVTLIVFAYNQDHYIREAIDAALAQTYSPLEIILSDDCSSDQTFAIMRELTAAYEGPHSLRLRQNTQNLGIGKHVSTAISESNGKYIAFAAGDDISEHDRIEHAIDTLLNPSANNTDALCLSFLSALTLIDNQGTPFGIRDSYSHTKRLSGTPISFKTSIHKFHDLITGTLKTSGPSRIIHRDLHFLFGDIKSDCFTEDIIYLFRSVLAGAVLYSTKETVRYRKHRLNISSPKSLYTKPFTGVEIQLRADLETAVQKGLISNYQSKQASRWIDENVALRSFYKSKLTGERPDQRDIFRLMRARHLSLRRKFGLFREYIGVR